MTTPVSTAESTESTRRRVLEAAVEIILEEGYYRASSNHIAKRAGVTWGVIQHHFGSRERLLLEVVRAGSLDLVASLRNASIRGETIEQRLDSLADVIWEHYRRPRFLAHVQVLLNLSKEPRTSADTVAALAECEQEVGTLWRKLVDETIPPELQRREMVSAIFHLIRGLAIGSNLLDAVPHSIKPQADEADPRAVLVRALTLYVADQ